MTPIEVIKNMNFCGLCTTGNCAECDRKIAKDEAIKALEEIQQYREYEKRLETVYGDCSGLLETLIESLERHDGADIGEPVFKSRLLTDEDVDKWEAYKAIGTPEECRAAVEKQKKIKEAFEKWKNDTSGIYAADDETTHLICALKQILRSEEE